MTSDELFYDIVRGEALLYEAALGGPRKYGEALEKAWLAMDDVPSSAAAKAAREFLEWIYRGGPKPSWVV